MKAPDLAVVDAAGVHEWKGTIEPLKAAAKDAHLSLAVVDLAKAHDKASLFGELDRALKLPEHFGHNWDALADVIEDRDWLGKKGRAVVLAHANGWRKEHPNEWSTLEDLLAEAVEFWKERNVAFWVFVA
ncbi:MAG TPA: barstar family protein [Casimicrobiaceae bacterium]|nr:barstar family protein [Casimicrobiaceae bacterium]